MPGIDAIKHGLHVGLDEAVERLSEQKVDASGMDSYTQEISKVSTNRFSMAHAGFFLLSVLTFWHWIDVCVHG